jgi:hypothetical protein
VASNPNPSKKGDLAFKQNQFENAESTLQRVNAELNERKQDLERVEASRILAVLSLPHAGLTLRPWGAGTGAQDESGDGQPELQDG